MDLLRFSAPLLSVFVVACDGGSGTPDGGVVLEPKLSAIQRGTFTPSCGLSDSCHKGTRPQKSLDLTAMAHARLVNVASMEEPTKKFVVPGQPESSYLMDKILDRNLPNAPQGSGETWTEMPPGALLEAERIEQIRAWIAAGALDD